MHHKISPEIKWVVLYCVIVCTVCWVIPRLSRIFVFFKIGPHENAFTHSKGLSRLPELLLKCYCRRILCNNFYLDELRLQNFKKSKIIFPDIKLWTKIIWKFPLCSVICTIGVYFSTTEYLYVLVLQITIMWCNVILSLRRTHLVLFDNNLKIPCMYCHNSLEIKGGLCFNL